MKPAVTYPDPERSVVYLLRTLTVSHHPDVTVGVGVPDGSRPSSPGHLEVAWDGTPTNAHPAADHPPIRGVARAAGPTATNALAQLARGLLLAHRGDTTINAIRPGMGVLPARDPDTRFDLASFTVLVNVRSTPIVEP